jgi:hypothetical protein
MRLIVAALCLVGLTRTIGLATAAVAATRDGGAEAGDGAQAGDAGAAAGDAARADQERHARSPAPAATAADVGAVPVAAPAATARLRGAVFEKGTRRRLAGASINVDAVPAGETDEQGQFAIDLPPGRHVVQVQLPGFEVLQQIVDVAAVVAADVAADVAAAGGIGVGGAPETFRLLRRSGDRRYETVVSASPQAQRISVGGEEARTTPGSTGDPFRVIESLPGVAQLQWPLALYAIRGANPGNTGFFVDGMRVPALFHFALGPSVIHPYLIERVDFYPGGYPARFGGYVSGAVAAETTSPPSDIAHASADLRVYDVGGIVTSPWDKGRGTIAIAGRYSYTGALASLVFSDVQFGYGDYQLRIDHALAGGRATLTAIGSFDSLTVNFRDIGNGALEFHRFDLRWERALGPGRLRLRGTVGTDWARSNLLESTIAIRGYSAVPRIDYGARLASWADVEVGVSAEAQRFRPEIPAMPGAPAFDDLARPRAALTAAAYAALALTLGSRLELAPGFRLARYFEQGVSRFGAEPRLNGRLRLGRILSLKGAVGQFTQMPSLPVGVPGFESFDLRDFGLQRSAQASLGAEANLGDAWQVDVTGFFQRLQVTDLRSTFSTDFRQMDYLEMRPGRGYGLELLIRRRELHRLHGWLAYTLSKSERQVEGVWGASDWDQRHIFNLVGSARLARGYSVGGRFHYHTGRPYPLNAIYQRLPAFHQLDLRADKRMVFDRYILTVYVELGNVTLTKEVTARSNMFDDSGNRTSDGVVRELGYRIILPSIGVHGEF